MTVDDNKRLFFLQLPKDFFGSRRIKKLRKMPDGDSLVLLYLKIQLSTLNTGGVIELSGLEESPADEIALEISEEPETVRTVLDFMIKHGLAIEQEDGNIFLPYVEIMTSSHTEEAERKRKYRDKKKGHRSDADGTTLGQPWDNLGTMSRTMSRQNIEYREEEQKNKERESIDTDINVPPTIQPTAPIDGGGSAAAEESKAEVKRKDVEKVKNAWNTLGLKTILRIDAGTERGRQTKARIQDFGVDAVLEAIENVRKSDFLCGKNKKKWVATYDWFIAPSNFQKVLEGNYSVTYTEEESDTDNIFLKMLEEENGQK